MTQTCTHIFFSSLSFTTCQRTRKNKMYESTHTTNVKLLRTTIPKHVFLLSTFLPGLLSYDVLLEIITGNWQTGCCHGRMRGHIVGSLRYSTNPSENLSYVKHALVMLDAREHKTNVKRLRPQLPYHGYLPYCVDRPSLASPLDGPRQLVDPPLLATNYVRSQANLGG